LGEVLLWMGYELASSSSVRARAKRAIEDVPKAGLAGEAGENFLGLAAWSMRKAPEDSPEGFSLRLCRVLFEVTA